MSKDMDTLQMEIDSWYIDIMGSGSLPGLLGKLIEESLETIGLPDPRIQMMLSMLESKLDPPFPEHRVRQEIADVAIVCLLIASYLSFSLSDEVEKKMVVNRARTWDALPDGRLKHRQET